MEKRKAQKLKEILPLANGLFAHMNYTFRAEVSKTNLDLQLLANYGQRNPSPIVEMIQETYGSKLTDSELTTLAGVILEMYKEKWDKLGALYDIQYDPIHNYLDEWNDELEGSESREGSRSNSEGVTYGKLITEGTSRYDTIHSTTGTNSESSSTRTDDLVKTETRNLESESTETRNLSDATTFGKTNTRTDNLTETTAYGKTEERSTSYSNREDVDSTSTRTDDLLEERDYGKIDTEDIDIKHEIKGSENKTNSDGSTQSVYAFNSAAALPSNTNINNGSSTLQYSSRENDDSGTDTHTLSGSDSVANTGTQTDVIDATTGNSGSSTDNLELGGSDARTTTGTQTDALSGTNTLRSTGTKTVANENTGTVTTADEGTETTTGSIETTSETSGTNNRNQTVTTGFTGTDRRNGSGTNSESSTNERERSGRHFGNIGNLTSQKQILEEINLWKWNYVKDILSDVKEFCTLPVYLNATEWQLVDPSED